MAKEKVNTQRFADTDNVFKFLNSGPQITGKGLTGKTLKQGAAMKTPQQNVNDLEAKQFDLTNQIGNVTNSLANMVANLYNAQQQYYGSSGGTIFTDPSKDIYYSMKRKYGPKYKALEKKLKSIEKRYNVNNSSLNNLESTIQEQEEQADLQENESNSHMNILVSVIMGLLGMAGMFI